jgi:cytochrome c peroxidase
MPRSRPRIVDIPRRSRPNGTLDAICRTVCVLGFLVSTLCCAASPSDSNTNTLGLPIETSSARDAHLGQGVVELGRRLFFDSHLSADGAVSCSKCHVPKLAFSDGLPQSAGNRDQMGTRNAPSLLNVVYAKSLFWDGRAPDLETQALAPLMNFIEHGFHSSAEVVQVVRSDPTYVEQFSRAFGRASGDIEMGLLQRALSAYERTLVSAGSAFDEYMYGHKSDALSAQALRGLALFRDRARCAQCHLIGDSFALFTDDEFHFTPLRLPAQVSAKLAALTKRVVEAKANNPAQLETLIATDKEVAALGRFIVTLNPADIGQFKTPSLRNVALTAPYMHDGSVQTLEEAVELELYGRGNSLAYPITLTAMEKSELIAFLRALTSPSARTHL